MRKRWLPRPEAAERDAASPRAARTCSGSRSRRPPWPGMVIVHGAGSAKENHADFGRACAAAGWAALAYDQRGHGERRRRDVARGARRRRADGALPRRPRRRRPGAGLRPRLEHGRLRRDPRRRDLAGDRRRDRDLPGGRGAPRSRAARRLARVPRRRAGARRPRRPGSASTTCARRSSCSAAKPLILIHAEGDERIPSEFSARALRARGRAAQADRPARAATTAPPSTTPSSRAIALRWLERALAG